MSTRKTTLFYALLIPVLLLVAKKSPAIAIWICGLFALADVHFGRRARGTRALSHMLNCPPAQFLGRISYCVYLFHLPALVFVRKIIRLNQPHWHAPFFQGALFVGGLAATIAGAWLLHTVVEQPMIKFGKRLTKAGKQRAPAPGVLMLCLYRS